MLKSLLGLFTRNGRKEISELRQVRALSAKYRAEGVRYPHLRAFAEVRGHMTKDGKLISKESK